MKKLLSIIILMMVAVLPAISQAPGIFNYQGVARNSVGNVLVNKSITLRLTIHDLTPGGAIVYQESRGVTTNPFGLFNAQVGSAGATSVTGTVAGVNWGVGAKYIQVEIDPNGGTSFINIGTAQLASVPYSIFATLAGDLALPFNKTQADAGTLFKITNSGTGTGSTALEGLTNSTAASANAIMGTVTSTTPGGFSAGIRGINNGTGGLGIGVYGSQNGSGWGVYGITPAGIGVNGATTTGFGVYGSSSGAGVGVYGTSSTGRGGFFEVINSASTADAVRAETNGTGASWAVRAISSGTNGAGLFQQTNATNTANNLQSTQAGLGRSGFFTSTNAANTANTVEAQTNGSGSAVVGSKSATTGTAAAVNGSTASTDANAMAVLGTVTSTTPGGFSSAIRGVNSGTGGLGIGVYGSQGGSGWGVYGTTPSGIGVLGNSTSGFGVYGQATSGVSVYGISSTGGAGQFDITNAASTADAVRANQSGLGRGVYALINNNSSIVAALRGETNGGGYGVFGQATGNGNAGFFQITNPASTSTVTNVTTNGIGSGVQVQLTNASNGARGLDVLQAGVGPGVFATSAGGNAVWGITSSISAAGVIGDNTFGEAVVGRNRGGNGVGAVVGRNDSSGYGVRGFNTKDGIGVLGQAGISGGTGVGGRFENVNAANTNNVLEVANNGIGSGITVQLTNASNGARGLDVLQTGVGPGVFATSAGGNAVWGITSSISAAGVIGDNTFGEAVVGRNRGGNGVGAVVGRNDSSGYGIRGFNTKDGIGALGQAGISGGTGIGGLFENVNAANGSVALIGRTNGTGAAFLANNTNGGVTDIAIFQKTSSNVARIDGTGKGFFNGGTQNSGADVAEMFDVSGTRNMYEPGDVLVISTTKDRTVEKSSQPYSTLVLGVYATKPGVILTEGNAEADQLDDMVPMGVIGVIPTKVCLEGGAIKRGDMIVTSSVPGVAMKADPAKVKTGQVIGKALEDFDSNSIGKIKVMVSVK